MLNVQKLTLGLVLNKEIFSLNSLRRMWHICIQVFAILGKCNQFSIFVLNKAHAKVLLLQENCLSLQAQVEEFLGILESPSIRPCIQEQKKNGSHLLASCAQFHFRALQLPVSIE